MNKLLTIAVSVALSAAVSAPAFAQNQSKFAMNYSRMQEQANWYNNTHQVKAVKNSIVNPKINHITGIVESNPTAQGQITGTGLDVVNSPDNRRVPIYSQTPQRTITIGGGQRKVSRPVYYQPQIQQQPQGYYYTPGQNSGANNGGTGMQYNGSTASYSYGSSGK